MSISLDILTDFILVKIVQKPNIQFKTFNATYFYYATESYMFISHYNIMTISTMGFIICREIKYEYHSAYTCHEISHFVFYCTDDAFIGSFNNWSCGC